MDEAWASDGLESRMGVSCIEENKRLYRDNVMEAERSCPSLGLLILE
jgi:hypothetical protein